MTSQELEKVIFENGTKSESSITLENSNILKAKKINDRVYIFWISYSLGNILPKIKYHFDTDGMLKKISIRPTLKPFIYYWLLPLIVLLFIITFNHPDSLERIASYWNISLGLFIFVSIIHFFGYYLVKQGANKELEKLIS